MSPEARPAWRPARLDEAVWTSDTSLCTTISGSFRRHAEPLSRTIAEMRRTGLRVLSPNSGDVERVDQGFAHLEGDPSRDKRWTEDRHLEAISRSDFLWVINPDGYLGLSTAFEMGYARAKRVPIFSASTLDEQPLRSYARPMPNWRAASIAAHSLRQQTYEAVPLLLNPYSAVQQLADLVGNMSALIENAGSTLTRMQAERLREMARNASELLGALHAD